MNINHKSPSLPVLPPFICLIFANMKKSTIWIIAVIMGISFLALLSLQAKYFEEVINMRKEQFETSVTRSLYQTARNLELNETKLKLEDKVSQHSKPLKSEKHSADHYDADAHIPKPHENLTGNVSYSAFWEKISPKGVNNEFRDSIRNQYLNQRNLLNEVVYSILYEPSEKPLAERIDFKALDNDLRTQLRNNGIDLDYHFYVTTSDGREVFRCYDYSTDGIAHTYRQVLFHRDPSPQMGLLYIHFPEMQKYIFSSVRFMIPAIIFTLILLVVFIYSIYTIFRQKKLTEIKNDFINNMTHEFKTPISTISLAAQMLRDPAVGKSEAMFKHISGIIFDETKRLRFQVEKVLQMSMFDRKAATFKRKEVEANALIQDTVNTFQIKVKAAGGEINSDLNATDDIIFVDEMHFTNVIFNLMDNAVKYKSAERDLKLKVTTRNEGNLFVITISDNGIGIKRDDLKKIFEKFYRVHTGNRHDVKGFGLGLAYVYNVIKALKGTIHAESEYGKGTRFIIKLPFIRQCTDNE